MKIEVKGKAAPGITAKDIVLAIIGKTGSAGGTGHVVEFLRRSHSRFKHGRPHDPVHMANEMGAAGLAAPDQTTFDYVKGRLHAPKGKDFDEAVAWWKTLTTDDGATFALSPCRRKRLPRRSPGAPTQARSSPSPISSRTRHHSPTR